MANITNLNLKPPLYNRELTLSNLKQFNLFVGLSVKDETRVLKAIQEVYKKAGVTTVFISAYSPEPKQIIYEFERLPSFKKAMILELLKELDLYVKHLSSAGSGTIRALEISLALVNAQNEVLLIERLGNYLHYTVIQKLIPVIIYVAKNRDKQIFATTYNLHCTRSLETVKEDVFTVQRIERDKKTTVILSREELMLANKFGIGASFK